jgi:hypothetical protein
MAFGPIDRGAAGSEAQMLDMEDGLIEQLRDMRMMQSVEDVLAASPANHEPEMAQLTQLVGTAEAPIPTASASSPTEQAPSLSHPQDLHPTGRGQDLHPLGHDGRGLRVNAARSRCSRDATTHPNK